MTIVANILIGLVALLHTYFLILEMFLWDKPQGRKTFGLTAEFATASKTLAANQGLYNGFLAAGLVGASCWARRATHPNLLPRLRHHRRAFMVGGQSPRKS